MIATHSSSNTDKSIPSCNTSFEEARRVFHLLRWHLNSPAARQRIWNEIFTEQQRDRLGNDLAATVRKYKDLALVWHELTNTTYPRAVIVLSVKLGQLTKYRAEWLLREGKEAPLEMTRSQAITEGYLVVHRNSREVWWRNEALLIEWGNHQVLWDFFVKACEHAKRNKALDYRSFGEDASTKIVAERKCRLKQLPGFPPELYDLFQIEGVRTQRLAISPDEIFLFED